MACFLRLAKQSLLFLAALSISDLHEIIPKALKDMFITKDKLEVMVFDTDSGDIGHKPWAVVPIGLIAANYRNKNTTSMYN